MTLDTKYRMLQYIPRGLCILGAEGNDGANQSERLISNAASLCIELLTPCASQKHDLAEDGTGNDDQWSHGQDDKCQTPVVNESNNEARQKQAQEHDAAGHLVSHCVLDLGQRLGNLCGQRTRRVAIVPANLLTHQRAEVSSSDGCGLTLAALGPAEHLYVSQRKGAAAQANEGLPSE